jgi:CHASE2 domain-containing sensor protein
MSRLDAAGRPPEESSWRSWRRDLGVVLVVSVLSSCAAHLGWLDGFETTGLDVLMNLPRIDARYVTVVEITDDDYVDLFDGRSPLDPVRLREVLAAIARGKPRLLGVDLETDESRIAAAPPVEGEPAQWPATVWVEPLVRGRHTTKLEGQSTVVRGVGAFPVDRDGVIRHYHRKIRRPEQPLMDSFPWAIVRVYCTTASTPECARAAAAPDDAEFLMNFAGNRFDYPRLTTAALLSASTGPAWGTERGPLFGRVVLLGGVFTAARETRVTPLGEMPGVYIVAQAIESELQGGGVRAVNELAMLLLDVVGGLLIVALHRHWSVPVAFWSSVIGTPVFALASSIVAFYSFSRWASFAPTFLGVLIHQLYEGAKHARGGGEGTE